MNASQRKAHKYIWILIAIALPILMYFSISYRPNISLEYGLSENKEPVEGSLETTLENDVIKVRLSEQQMHLYVKRPVKSAATLIYAIDKDGKATQLLGQVGNQRTYVFEYEGSITGIRVFDPVKDTEITKLIF